jgi:threonine/homoserine/homoserine lactone efflux protein
MNFKGLKTWYNNLPINPTLKTAILLGVSVSVFVGAGYLGYQGIKKIRVRMKPAENKDNKETEIKK